MAEYPLVVSEKGLLRTKYLMIITGKKETKVNNVIYYGQGVQCTMEMFPLRVGIRIYLEKSVNWQLSLSIVLMPATSH